MKVLVIVDAQNDFITGSLGSEEAKKVVPNIMCKIESYEDEDLIIATLDTHTDDYLKSQEGKYLSVKHCVVNESGWYMHKDISASFVCSGNPNSVLKNTFGSIDLPHVISNQSTGEEIESIELVGYVLDICVISNALLLKAFFPEVPITVDTNCCAATSPEAREAAKIILKSCQIEVIE
jgi:nicotinamidase-related amidase